MVAVSPVVSTTIGPTWTKSVSVPLDVIEMKMGEEEGVRGCSTVADFSFLQYHPGYFGKVGMRHYHLLKNHSFRPTINIDKVRLPSSLPDSADPSLSSSPFPKQKSTLRRVPSPFSTCSSSATSSWWVEFLFTRHLLTSISLARDASTSRSS